MLNIAIRISFYTIIFMYLYLFEYHLLCYKSNLYKYILNPIEILDDVYIFSSILDKNRIRIILFMNNKNITDSLKNISCTIIGSKVLYSILLFRQYKILHEKYYNLLCDIQFDYKQKYNLHISNKQVSLYNNYQNPGKYNLLFCLTTLFSYNNTKRFIEFIEYYRNFGVDKFIIYNTNCSKEIEQIYKHYKQNGVMDIIYDNFTHMLYEIKRFHIWKHNDCFHRYKYSANRIIFTDHDEIIYSPLYNTSNSFFSHLNQNAASYHFYPKLIITHGKGFFGSGNYSICPYKLWKFVINIPICVLHVAIHDVVLKRKCFKERVPINLGYVLHARNIPSYHAKACKNWTYEKISYN